MSQVQYRRIKDALGLAAIEPLLLPDPDYPPGHLIGQLRMMVEHPQGRQDICILAANVGPKIVGYGIVMCPANQRHTFILQTWVDPKYSAEGVAGYMLHIAEEWSLQKGRDEIRAESRRNSQAILRRGEFAVYSRVYSRKIKRGGSTDGTEQQPEKHEHVDPRPAANGGDRVQQVHQARSRKGKQPRRRRRDGVPRH